MKSRHTVNTIGRPNRLGTPASLIKSQRELVHEADANSSQERASQRQRGRRGSHLAYWAIYHMG